MKKTIVIKAGGELMGSAPARKKIIAAIAQWKKKADIAFIHGGGPQIESQLVKQNIPSKFINGRRFTSPEAISVIEQVLSGEINKSIAAEMSSKKIPAVGLSCRDGNIMKAIPIAHLGRAGKPNQIKTELLKVLFKGGFTPVVSSIASDTKGNPLNINADDAASALACQLKASHLILLTNISGVLDHMKNRIAILKIDDIDRLIQEGVITGGMIPKVQSAKQAIQKGVGEVDIVNGFQGINFNFGTRIVP